MSKCRHYPCFSALTCLDPDSPIQLSLSQAVIFFFYDYLPIIIRTTEGGLI